MCRGRAARIIPDSHLPGFVQHRIPVSHHRPIRPEDRHQFDALIDARSPAEYAEDHIPGAINCPVLNDEERAIVGTIYVQQSAFEARRVAGLLLPPTWRATCASGLPTSPRAGAR